MMTAKTEYFDHPLPADAVSALLGHFVAARVFGESREVAFTPWRGAYSRVRPPDTAFPHRDAAYLVKHTVLLGPAGAARRGQDALNWLASSWSTLHPHGTGHAYPNYPDPTLPDWPTAYYGANLGRLRAVKAAYDPHNLFCFAQSIQ
jgi:hypothetical protein